MSMCYAVLWIPTVNHLPIPFEEPLNDGVKIADISDIIGRPFNIKIQTNGKNIDIFTQNEKECDAFDPFITLHFEKFSHNGMIKYSFEPKFFENGEFGFDDKSFPGVVYHIIKGFYHIHEFHENETDSSLLPYLSKKDINIGEPDNEAIKHYLKNFERIILVLVNLAREFSDMVQDKGKKDPEFVQKDFDTFFKMYIMVRGYDAYQHSLYKSVYNKKCQISNEDEKELRRCAFNIENSVRYFNVLFTFFDTLIRKNNTLSILKNVEENLRKSEESLSRISETLENSKKSIETSELTLKTTEETLKTSELTLKNSNTNIEETKDAADKSTKWAIAGIIFSVILSIASISYSIYLSNLSSKELKETSTDLETSFKSSMEMTECKLDSLIRESTTKSESLKLDSVQRNK